MPSAARLQRQSKRQCCMLTHTFILLLIFLLVCSGMAWPHGKRQTHICPFHLSLWLSFNKNLYPDLLFPKIQHQQSFLSFSFLFLLHFLYDSCSRELVFGLCCCCGSLCFELQHAHIIPLSHTSTVRTH